MEPNSKYKHKQITDIIVKNIFKIVAIICGSFVVFITGYILYKGIYPFIHNYSLDSNTVIKQDFRSFFTNQRWLYDGTGGMTFLLLTTLYPKLPLKLYL